MCNRVLTTGHLANQHLPSRWKVVDEGVECERDKWNIIEKQEKEEHNTKKKRGKCINPILPKAKENEGKEREEEEERCSNERKGTRGEGTRAGMSRLLVSQTRGRYFADQWQSTGKTRDFRGIEIL